jgi:hypothetical protein
MIRDYSRKKQRNLMDKEMAMEIMMKRQRQKRKSKLISPVSNLTRYTIS